jgi:hypothetical protein
MQGLTTTAVLLLSACASLFSPAPPGKGAGSEGEAGPVEIDFSPLPGKDGKVSMLDKDGKATYEILIVVETAYGPKFEQSYNIAEGTSAGAVRDLATGSFADGWKLEPVGDDKLIVRAYKDSPVRSAEVKVERIPLSMTPTVHRLKEKAKDK